jgi:hypothetical protein|tara:strand:+ start:345 stop:584 length:240 start_codon:yes stop_codon:yes gene_type:complete
MEWLKSLWAKWKVHISVAGGVLVIATAYGTCSVDPTTVSDNSSTDINTTETVEVSATTEVPGEVTITGETTDTTTTTTE